MISVTRRRLPYVFMDVFTDRPLEGNQLAIFTDARGLSTGEMRQRDPEAGVVHDKEQIARAAGLSLNEIAPDLPVQTFTTGLPFIIVPVISLDAIRKVGPWSKLAQYRERGDGGLFYFVTAE